MADGFVMGPGERVLPAMRLKVGDKNLTAWPMFEVVDIGSGFDVSARLHRNAEDVLECQLDLLAFEPRVRIPGNWQSWQSHSGATVARGGLSGHEHYQHEHYQKELAELVASMAGPLDAAIAGRTPRALPDRPLPPPRLEHESHAAALDRCPAAMAGWARARVGFRRRFRWEPGRR
jgi:hypothetical protein